MTLTEEIKNLVAIKTEGDYWDFKEMWYNNKASLLHDIICMANNQVGKDAYIIIGVSDSKSADGVKIKGVSDDEKRKDQQHLIDFLRGKKFAGGMRPTVYIQTIELPDDNGVNQPIDIIIIPNSTKTPFFLIDDFGDKDKKIRAGYIYTRIGDTNTAINSFADIDKIEYLWRKRFGIDLSVNDKLLRLLDEPDDWIGDFNNGSLKYHRLFPEFQININEIENQSQFLKSSIITSIADHYDNKFNVCELVITCYSTKIFEEYMICLDNRYLIPLPQIDTVYISSRNDPKESLPYLFFAKDNIKGKLFNCLAKTKNKWYDEKWNLRPGIAFLLFENYCDKTQFDRFVKENLQIINEEYNEALRKKNILKKTDTEELFSSRYSKASEIKAWHLYEMYRKIDGDSLISKIQLYLKAGDDN